MNLMNSDHKATNQSYRDGYDNIQWDGKEKPAKKVVKFKVTKKLNEM